MMKTSVQEYVSLITSLEPVSMNNISEVDLEGIRDGEAYEGMSKESVTADLGYPGSRKTPSLEAIPGGIGQIVSRP